MTLDFHASSVNIGALTNAVRPLFKVPAGLGGISVVAANVYQMAAGTVSLNLVQLGTAGTAVGGTLATLGSAVYTSGMPKPFVVTTPFVDPNYWVGIEEKGVGTCNAITMVDIEYVVGK